MNFAIGLIEKKLVDNLKLILKGNRSITTKANEILTNASNKFRDKFRKLVWNYRCEIIIETDEIRGISRKDKRNPKGKENRSVKKRKRRKEGKTSENRSNEEERRTNHNQSETTNDIYEKEKIIYDWIRGGIKWLGY